MWYIKCIATSDYDHVSMLQNNSIPKRKILQITVPYHTMKWVYHMAYRHTARKRNSRHGIYGNIRHILFLYIMFLNDFLSSFVSSFISRSISLYTISVFYLIRYKGCFVLITFLNRVSFRSIFDESWHFIVILYLLYFIEWHRSNRDPTNGNGIFWKKYAMSCRDFFFNFKHSLQNSDMFSMVKSSTI